MRWAIGEQEWLESNKPRDMLIYLVDRRPRTPGEKHVRTITSRKLRLFACAVARAALPSPDLETESCICVAESDADDRDSPTDALLDAWRNMEMWCCEPDSWLGALESAGILPGEQGACILRDIFRHPDLPCPMTRIKATGPGAASNPLYHRAYHDHAKAWLTPDVRFLATAAYSERLPSCEFDSFRLGMVADALEEAGCPGETESPCPRCSPYKEDRCPQCNGSGSITYFKGPVATNPTWRTCNTCSGTRTFPPGFHPERDPASGRHEGGWTNCKTCNGGGRKEVRPGTVLTLHPLLAHLRSPEPHYRGMWSLDVVLGKS